MDCEVLLCAHTAGRGVAILKAMIAAADRAGVRTFVSDHYTGRSKWLMTYGLGHTGRRIWTDAHIKAGGRLIGWDLGYWDRESAMRLTIDRDHPQHLIKNMNGSRFDLDNVQLRNDYNPHGPIVLAGLGRKTREALNDVSMSWERNTLAAIQSAYPKARVLYRSKRQESFWPLKSLIGDVEKALRGASLVVCRHSNIAIDACIAGIPVVCSDGIAAALYGNDLNKVVKPDLGTRLQFLRNVAWWQWRPTEAEQAWKQIISILN